MTQSFPIHDTLPSGFTFANALQAEQFAASGSIDGASKIAQVRSRTVPGATDLAIRFRPPRFLKSVASSLGRGSVETAEEYIAEYNKGWRYARTSDGYPSGSFAMEDGFLDAAAGRAKWHLTYCTDHDNCGEG